MNKENPRRSGPGRYILAAAAVVLVGLLCFSGERASAPVPEENLPEETPEQTVPERYPEPEIEIIPLPEAEDTAFSHTFVFAGDVSLADGAKPTGRLNRSGGDVDRCIDSYLLEQMRGADVFCLNSEFAFTGRGSPLPGKTFTFRGDPRRVSVYHDMGVDLVGLANNHVFDFGEVGLLDTLNTFREAGLPYIGAGEDIDEASRIWYWEGEHCTVAFLAASRVEWSAQTRGATESRSGVFRTAESNELLYQRVREAKEQADFVIVFMHWGTESTTALEGYQLTTGQGLAEAGADVVVGAHPHRLQGIAYEGEVPVFYSIGNFWFSGYTVDVGLLEITLYGDCSGVRDFRCRIIPARQLDSGVDYYESPGSQRAYYDRLESISPGVIIDDAGYILPES